MLAGSELILGVTGSIAAYKAAYLLRELRRAGALVTVVTTAHAERFVGALTWRTLSGRPVLTDLFDPRSEEAVEHVARAERAHAVIVAPESGELASGLAGKGRLPEVDSILEAVERLLTPVRDLAGERVLVTSGPTREPIDPVRYLSNRSSGKMGHALATAALRRGAEVVLISGPTSLTPPAGAVYVPVQTAEEMREAALQHIESATIVIKAAAVADYRVRDPRASKIKI